MDLDKITLKFKMNQKGTHHIAYCEEYPQVQGIGPSQEQATANFWKAFNKAELLEQANVSEQKKSARLEAEQESSKGKGKKAA